MNNVYFENQDDLYRDFKILIEIEIIYSQFIKLNRQEVK